MRKILLCVLIGTSLVGCDNNLYTDYRKQLDLVGNVKTIKESTYNIGYKFGKPTKGEESILGLIQSVPCADRYISFNIKGQILKVVTTNHYQKDNKIEQVCTYGNDNEMLSEKAYYDRCLISYTQYDSTPRLSESKYLYAESADYFYKSLVGDFLPKSILNDGTRYDFKDTTIIVTSRSPQIEGIVNKGSHIRGIFVFTRDGYIAYNMSETDYYMTPQTSKSLACVELKNLVKEYDDEGRIILQDEIKGGKTRFEYDEKGQVLIETSYYYNGDTKSFTVFNTDENGLMHSKGIHNSDGSKVYFDYKYNKLGQLLRVAQNSIYSDGHHSSPTNYFYTFDSKNRISTCKAGYGELIIHRDTNNRIISYAIIHHDKKGNRVEEEYDLAYIPNSTFRVKNIRPSSFDCFSDVETTFDNRGNWVGKLCYKDGKPDIYYERTITYFE